MRRILPQVVATVLVVLPIASWAGQLSICPDTGPPYADRCKQGPPDEWATGPKRCDRDSSVTCTSNRDCRQARAGFWCYRWAFVDQDSDGLFEDGDTALTWHDVWGQCDRAELSPQSCTTGAGGTRCCNDDAVDYKAPYKLCCTFRPTQLPKYRVVLETRHGITTPADAPEANRFWGGPRSRDFYLAVHAGGDFRNYSYGGWKTHAEGSAFMVKAANVILGSDHCPARDARRRSDHVEVVFGTRAPAGEGPERIVLKATDGCVVGGRWDPGSQSNGIRLRGEAGQRIVIQAPTGIRFPTSNRTSARPKWKFAADRGLIAFTCAGTGCLDDSGVVPSQPPCRSVQTPGPRVCTVDWSETASQRYCRRPDDTWTTTTCSDDAACGGGTCGTRPCAVDTDCPADEDSCVPQWSCCDPRDCR